MGRGPSRGPSRGSTARRRASASESSTGRNAPDPPHPPRPRPSHPPPTPPPTPPPPPPPPPPPTPPPHSIFSPQNRQNQTRPWLGGSLVDGRPKLKHKKKKEKNSVKLGNLAIIVGRRGTQNELSLSNGSETIVESTRMAFTKKKTNSVKKTKSRWFNRSENQSLPSTPGVQTRYH